MAWRTARVRHASVSTWPVRIATGKATTSYHLVYKASRTFSYTIEYARSWFLPIKHIISRLRYTISSCKVLPTQIPFPELSHKSEHVNLPRFEDCAWRACSSQSGLNVECKTARIRKPYGEKLSGREGCVEDLLLAAIWEISVGLLASGSIIYISCPVCIHADTTYTVPPQFLVHGEEKT